MCMLIFKNIFIRKLIKGNLKTTKNPCYIFIIWAFANDVVSLLILMLHNYLCFRARGVRSVFIDREVVIIVGSVR